MIESKKVEWAGHATRVR